MSRLDELNQQIDGLMIERKIWLDNHFMDFAKFKVGDKIYAEIAADGYKMRPAGVVTRVYCRHINSSVGPNVHYEFTPDPSYRYGSNTEGGWSYYYTHEDWVRRQNREIERIKRTI